MAGWSIWVLNSTRVKALVLAKEMQAIAEARQESMIASAKLASLGALSTGFAHEINNPLTTILSALSALPSLVSNPEKFAMAIERSKRNCRRIAKIVAGVKKFSKSQDSTPLERRKLANIVHESLILTELKSKEHNTPVTIENEVLAEIDCDEIEIEQVLINLINNSIDAVQAVPEKWVKISLTEDDTSVILRIIDSGPGISEQVRSRIFDPFFSTKRAGEGTGLGLSITKGILDRHHASIRVDTEVPNTCFEIKFKKSQAAKIPA